jgi:2-polyprenyl-6-methoxyphenol hydroxylase-like FAD-dependent oxidoreductase
MSVQITRPDTRTALVIGGGIGGPVAAMALQQAGIEATVYEAYAGTADGVGGALSIAPNGLDALDAIGAGDAVRRVGSPMTAIVLESWNGRRLAEFGTPAGLPPQQVVLRTELYRALHDEAARRGIRTEYGKRLVAAETTEQAVTARFADGTEARADVLVGSDGIRSTVRRIIDPAAPEPRYAGLQGFGAIVPESGLASTGGRMHMTFGKRAFFGLQVFDDGTAVWFVNLPHREPLTTAQARALGAETWLARLREACAGDRTPAVALIDRTPPEELIVTGPSEAMPRVPAWYRDRMVLIGDAAHAASSSSGQGASLAAESAVQLARCLRDLPRDRAFPAYEALRRERVERIIAAAARTNSGKAAGPVGRVIRDALMPVFMKFADLDKAAAPFRHHIDWAAPVTPAAAPGHAVAAV